MLFVYVLNNEKSLDAFASGVVGANVSGKNMVWSPPLCECAS